MSLANYQKEDGGVFVLQISQPSLVVEIKEKKELDPDLKMIKSNVGQHKVTDVVIGGDGVLSYKASLYVPNIDRLRERVMDEGHESQYAIPLDSTKMYHDLREFYWLGNMKLDMAIYMAKCMVCQQVQFKHIRPESLYQEIPLPE
ncbi:uncharacterized protein LOC124897977 [Capsicum annuum]|uniref:uncharacterized protein LOC124897977 n=1 Tax=Capsicum annuum TaxID=4072 RepID=UPI001FB18D75|nr:uncharacterized protein LOC124897977 [Capsicum annuum]